MARYRASYLELAGRELSLAAFKVIGKLDGSKMLPLQYPETLGPSSERMCLS